MSDNMTESVSVELADIRVSLNAAFLVLMGIIVFLMQGVNIINILLSTFL